MDEKEIEEKSEVKTEEVVTEVKKAAKKTITTAVIVKRTIQVILLIALIPILYSCQAYRKALVFFYDNRNNL